MSRVVFVGNIPYNFAEEQLVQIFSSVGSVTGFRLVFDRDTGKPKGYGFCEYSDHETAQSAVRNLNGKDVGGRPLRIDLADSVPHLEGRTTSLGELLDDEKNRPPSPVEMMLNSLPPGISVPPGKTSLDMITDAVVGVGQGALFETVFELKGFISQQPELARALLAANPQLASALMQGLVIHNVIDGDAITRVTEAGQRPPGPPMQAAPPGPWPPTYNSFPPPAALAQQTPIPPSAATAAVSSALDPQQQAILLQILKMSPEQINSMPAHEREAILQLRKQLLPAMHASLLLIQNIMPVAAEELGASQLQEHTQTDGGDVILSASLQDVAPFVALLKATNGLSNTASLIFSKAGIKIEVEYKRALQATAYLASSLFDQWSYEPTPTSDREDDTMEPESVNTEIEINLGILNEVLSIYGSGGGNSSWRKKGRGDDHNDEEDEIRGPMDRYMIPKKAATSMRMSYGDEGHPLRLSLAERAEGPTTVCQIHTLVSERRMELTFDDEAKIVKIIMKSSWLRDALSEIDSSCDYVTIICNPPQKVTRAGKGRENAVDESFFRIEARMQRGSVEMDYPNDREVLEFFECGAPVRFNYSFDVIQRAIRALTVSVKVSIRIDGDGVMSLQFLMPTESSGERKTWMEFRFLARDDNL